MTRPATLTWPCPSSAVKITRKINGNAKVKNADAGLRQNALLTYRNWKKVSVAVFIGVPPARCYRWLQVGTGRWHQWWWSRRRRSVAGRPLPETAAGSADRPG